MGYEPGEMNTEFLMANIHPDDKPYLLFFEDRATSYMRSIPSERYKNYKIQYDLRVKKKDNKYARILMQYVLLNYDEENIYLDLQEGNFVDHQPVHPHFLDGEPARLTSLLLKVMQPYELEDFRLNQEIRRALLLRYQDYYALHIQDFGQLKTLLVLHEVL